VSIWRRCAPTGSRRSFWPRPPAPTRGLKAIAEASEGFVYAISRVGITGTRNRSRAMPLSSSRGCAPSPSHAESPSPWALASPTRSTCARSGEFADAAVIGSALVAMIEITKPSQAPAAIGRSSRGCAHEGGKDSSRLAACRRFRGGRRARHL